MPCDLEKNRRRLAWQYLNTENAPCVCQRGFRLDGSMCRQYWCEFDEPQADPTWQWLDGGFLLTHDPVPPLLVDCWFRHDDFANLGEVFLQYTGYNEVQTDGTAIWTVEARFIARVLTVVGGPAFVQADSFQRPFAPANNSGWRFFSFAYSGVFVPPPPELTGTAVITPLQACHDCTD